MEEISLTGATLLGTSSSDNNGASCCNNKKNDDEEAGLMDPLLLDNNNENNKNNSNVVVEMASTHDHQPGCKNKNHNHNHQHHQHQQPNNNLGRCPQQNAALQAMQSLMVPMETLVESHENEPKMIQTLWTLIRLGSFAAFERLWNALEVKKLSASGNSDGMKEGAVLLPYLSRTDPSGHLLFHWAAKRVDDVRFVEFLIDKCQQYYNKNKTTAANNTNNNGSKSNYKIMELLTKQSRDSSGMTPIHWACTESERSIRILSRMLSAATEDAVDNGTASNNKIALLEVQDKSGCTPLLIAAQHGQTNIVAYLIQKGANLHATDHMKDTAMHWACYKGSIQVIGLLLYYYNNSANNGSNGGSSNGGGRQKPQQTQQEKADIAASIFMMPDSYKQTPIHLASLRGHTSTVRYLLYHVTAGTLTVNINNQNCSTLGGANNKANNIYNKNEIRHWLSIKDKNNRTPLELAIHKSRPNVAIILQKAELLVSNTQRNSNNNATATAALCCLQPSQQEIIANNIREFFSLHSWKLWLGFVDASGTDEIDEPPKAPYYYLWFHIVLQIGIFYPFVFCPIHNISAGLLWDYSSWHMFNALLMVFTVMNLVWVHRTSPGNLIANNSNNNDSSQNINLKLWQQLYQQTLQSYTQNEQNFGDHPSHKIPLCHTCHIARPLRSKHCRVQRCCVLMFDHHCPFVDNTVGLYNYKYFYLFLMSMGIYLAGFWFNYCLYIHRHNQQKQAEDYNPFYYYLFVVVGFYAGLHAIPSIGMFVYHTQLMLVNLTTNEHSNLYRYDYLHKIVTDKDGSGSFDNKCCEKHGACPSHNNNTNNNSKQPQVRKKYMNPWFKGLVANYLNRFTPNESMYMITDVVTNPSSGKQTTTLIPYKKVPQEEKAEPQTCVAAV